MSKCCSQNYVARSDMQILHDDDCNFVGLHLQVVYPEAALEAKNFEIPKNTFCFAHNSWLREGRNLRGNDQSDLIMQTSQDILSK